MLLRSVLLNASAEGADGTAATSAPPAPPAPAAPAAEEPAKKRTIREAREMLKNGGLRAFKDQGKPAPAAPAQAAPVAAQPAPQGNAAAIADAPSAETQAIAEAIDDAGGKVPEQKEDESIAEYKQRLLKQMQRTRELEVAEKREKEGRLSAEKKAAELDKRMQQADRMLARGKDPEAVLEFIEETTGHTLESLVIAINEGKVKVGRNRRAELPPELQEELEAQRAELARLKQAEEERQQQAMTQRQQQAFAADLETSRTYLKQNADKYPVLAAASWAAGDVVRTCYAENSKAIDPVAQRLEEGLATSLLSVVGDERAMRAMLKRDPQLKARIAAALGVAAAPKQAAAPAQPKTAAASPPVARLPTEAPTPPPQTLSKAEKRHAAIAGIRQRKHSG